MKQLSLFLVLASWHLVAQQVVRVEPQNFSTIYNFGGAGSFNENEIAVHGFLGPLPNVTPKVYLFNMASEITPNGLLSSPEANQDIGGAIEMTDDYLFIGSISNDTNVNDGGAVYVYKKVAGNWQYVLKLQPPTQAENDRFGSNIVFHNGQLFVTAGGYDSNGNSAVNNGGIYHYYLLPDGTFSFVQVMTGNPTHFGFGDLLDFDGNMLVTTSEDSTTDTVYTYSQGNVAWLLNNTMQMPVFTQEDVNVPASYRVSFSNGKLYLFHLEDNNPFPLLEGKMIQIYDWSDAQMQWDFSENFFFEQGDYIEYKVKVEGNNMYLIPIGDYFLLMERKNQAYHYRFDGTNWNYHNSYAGMSSEYSDDFGYFTVTKGDKVLFGNQEEKWGNPATTANGGAYMLDNTLSTDEFDSQSITLFPNPTNGIISITSNSELTQIEIYDSLGKSITTQNANFSSINLTSLSSGIYICKLINSNGQVQFKKIVKE